MGASLEGGAVKCGLMIHRACITMVVNGVTMIVTRLVVLKYEKHRFVLERAVQDHITLITGQVMYPPRDPDIWVYSAKY